MENRSFTLQTKQALIYNSTERRKELNTFQFCLKMGMVYNHSENDGNLLLFAVVKEVTIEAVSKMLYIASVDVV